MQFTSLKMFAAVAAAISIAGLAQAQYAAPNQGYNYQNPYALRPVQAVQPPAAAAATSLPPGPGAAMPGAPAGCTNCGPVYGKKLGTAWGPGLAPVPYGEYCRGCANGCGSLKSDLGFFFGSCKSFFSPCGPVPCQGCGGHLGKCGAFPYGRPYANGYNTCCYDSYLNH